MRLLQCFADVVCRILQDSYSINYAKAAESGSFLLAGELLTDNLANSHNQQFSSFRPIYMGLG